MYDRFKNDHIFCVLSALSAFGFAIAMLGYSNGMISRVNIYFSTTFLVFIPYFINNISNISLGKDMILPINVLFFVYFMLRFNMYVSSDSLELDGMQVFKFIWS